MLRRMPLRRKADPKTGTHTLREPAQSKCMSTFQKSHFIRKFTGKMLCPRLSPERGHTFCASLRSRNALQHFRRPALYGNFQEKCHAPKPRRTHFVRASAVEMHFNISQNHHRLPLLSIIIFLPLTSSSLTSSSSKHSETQDYL